MQRRSTERGLVRRAAVAADWVLVATVMVLGTALGVAAVQHALRGF